MSRPITLVMPYYDNPGMLEEQQKVWDSYPAELKQLLHVILVDDGSPRWPAEPVWRDVGLASARLYRCDVDVRWNWIACRNYAMSVATTDWCLMTDIDHVMPVETLRTLTRDGLASKSIYRLSRVDAPNRTEYKPHPNTWFLTRRTFDKIGGYDERFSGYYGTDADFRDRATAAAGAPVMLPDVMIRYPREVLADASTTTYGRKEEQDRVNVARIREERAKDPNWRPLRGSFNFERIR